MVRVTTGRYFNPLSCLIAVMIVIAIGFSSGFAATEIEFASWYSPAEELGKTLRYLVDMFEEENPQIKVHIRFTPFERFHDRIIVESIAGVEPDISLVSGMHFTDFQGAGMFLPITRLSEHVSNFSIGDFYAESGAQGKYEGEYYALPFAGGPQRALWYNIDVFSEAGLNPEQPPNTWEELLDFAQLLTRISSDGTVYRHGLNDDLGLLAWAVANGAEITDVNGSVAFNNSKYEETVSLFMRLIEEQIVRPNPDWSGQALKDGDVAMDANGTWMRGTFESLDANVGLTELPRGSEDGLNMHSADLIAVFRSAEGTDREEAAWKLAAYLTSPEIQGLWAKTTGFSPMNRNTIRTLEYLDFVMQNEAQWMATEMMEHIYAFPSIPNAPQVGAVAHKWTWEILNGNVSPVEGLERATHEANVLVGIGDK